MKRVWIALGLVAAILAGGIFSLWHLERITREMGNSLEQLSLAVEQQDDARILELALMFQEQWQQFEPGIRRYIHHDELESITGGSARLAALARYQDYGELAAETDRMRHLVNHILESERPTLKNIF